MKKDIWKRLNPKKQETMKNFETIFNVGEDRANCIVTAANEHFEVIDFEEIK